MSKSSDFPPTFSKLAVCLSVKPELRIDQALHLAIILITFSRGCWHAFLLKNGSIALTMKVHYYHGPRCINISLQRLSENHLYFALGTQFFSSVFLRLVKWMLQNQYTQAICRCYALRQGDLGWLQQCNTWINSSYIAGKGNWKLVLEDLFTVLLSSFAFGLCRWQSFSIWPQFSFLVSKASCCWDHIEAS